MLRKSTRIESGESLLRTDFSASKLMVIDGEREGGGNGKSISKTDLPSVCPVVSSSSFAYPLLDKIIISPIKLLLDVINIPESQEKGEPSAE